MNSKKIKWCKHGRTFVDDFWDTWDKVVDKLACKIPQKKPRDNIILRELNKENKPLMKSDKKNENISSQPEDKNLVVKSKKTEGRKNDIKDKSRPLRKRNFTKETSTMTNVTDCQPRDEEILYNTSCKEPCGRYKEMLQCIKREQKLPNLEELANHSNVLAREQDSKPNAINEKQTAQPCPSCESRKKVKLSDSYTQHYEQTLPESNSSKESLSSSDCDSTIVSDEEEELTRLKVFPKSERSELDFWKIYDNYKKAYKNCYKPLSEDPPSSNGTHLDKHFLKNKKNTEYYQEQLSQAYRNGIPPNNQAQISGIISPKRGQSPARKISPVQEKSCGDCAKSSEKKNTPTNTHNRPIIKQYEMNPENKAFIKCLPTNGVPQRTRQLAREASPAKYGRPIQGKAMMANTFSSKVAKPDISSRTQNYIVKEKYSLPGIESKRFVVSRRGPNPTRIQCQEKQIFLFPEETTKTVVQRSTSPCRDRLLNTMPFSNNYCSVSALTGLPTPDSSDFTTSA